jgi:hypothetical protein
LTSCALFVVWLDSMYALHGYMYAASLPFILNRICAYMGHIYLFPS